VMMHPGFEPGFFALKAAPGVKGPPNSDKIAVPANTSRRPLHYNIVSELPVPQNVDTEKEEKT
jgi:hypothetical protein